MRALVLACLALLAALPALAQSPGEVRLDISSGARRIRIQCESLKPAGDRTAGAMAVQADEVLASDLEHSAVFDVHRLWSGGQTPFTVVAVVGGRWQVRGAQVRLTGEVRDVPAGRSILVREYAGPLAEWRSLAHRFADDVVAQFTGEPGVSNTRIAFVGQKGRDKELYVMDADGAGIRALTADHSIVLTPSWSPEGSLLLYSSYRAGKGPQVFVMPSAGGRAFLVSGRPGLNTSACYSPDGREIACTLSMDGNSEVYALDARGGSPRRLTSNRAIDTSPAWSPTGREIAFTSDRGGSPQVYLMDRDGGNVRRLTYEVDYTDSPAWSPRGDRIAFVARTGGGFDLWVAQADGSGARVVVSGGSNEDPQWSPDGRHLVFSSNRDGSEGIYITDLDDRPARRLDTGGLRATSPAWSPRVAGSAGESGRTSESMNTGGNR